MNKKEFEEWVKKHTTELGILKKIDEISKTVDLFIDSLEELKSKAKKCGELLNQLEECNPRFFKNYCALRSTIVKETENLLKIKKKRGLENE